MRERDRAIGATLRLVSFGIAATIASTACDGVSSARATATVEPRSDRGSQPTSRASAIDATNGAGPRADGSGSSATLADGVLYAVTADGLVQIDAHGRRVIGAGLFPSRWRLPDGRLVAIASKGDGSPDAEQLALIDREGRVTRVGFSAPQLRDPAVAHDGRSIVVAANRDGHSDLYRIDVATGRDTRLTDDVEGNFAPAVAGDSIVFVSSRDGDAELYRRSARGKVVRLTAFHRDDWAPAPSPDGKTIAFLSDREGPVRLFAMSIDGTQLRRLVPSDRPSAARSDGPSDGPGDGPGDAPGDGDVGDPVWSFDGAWLAYTVQRSGGRSEVWVRDMRRNASWTITAAGASDHEPAFAPDGRSIVVSRELGAQTDLWIVPLAPDAALQTTQVARRLAGEGAEKLPRWFAR